MPWKDYIASGIKIKQKSIFDLGELYSMMYRWFELYGYDFQELEYRDSMEPGGKHVEIRWYAEKKVDDYVKFAIKPSFIVLGLQDIEAEREGGKVKTNKGEVEMRFDAYLEKDYQNKWETGVSRFLREVYDKFIAKRRLEMFEQELYEELRKLTDEVKAFLNIHRF